MDHRIGVCSSCGATYKLPASFEASRAKCKECSGVVDVGPVQSAPAPPPAPAAPAPPVPARKPAPPKQSAPPRQDPAPRAAAPEPKAKPSAPEEVVPKKKERSGPSMKERLLAQRRAEAAEQASKAGAGAVIQPAAKAAPKPAGSPATRPAAKPAAPAAKSAARPAKPAKSAAGAPAPAAKAARGSRRSAPARSRGRRGRGAEDDAEGEDAPRGARRGGGHAHGHHGHPHRKQSPVPAIVGVAMLVAAAGGLFWYLNNDDNEANAADNQVAAENAAETPTDAEATPAADESTPEETAADDGAAADGAEPDLADATSGAEDAPADAAAAAAASEDAGPDPASVDLTAIPDYGPIEGCSDDRFAELTELAQTFLDPDAGAAGKRAENSLREAGKEAFPAVLNELKKIDFSTDQGRKDGDIAQRLLMSICNGNNFGWRYTTDPKDVYFNKKVVVAWANQWDKAKDNEEYWLRLSKQDKGETAEAPKPADDAPKGLSEDDLDDLDDI